MPKSDPSVRLPPTFKNMDTTPNTVEIPAGLEAMFKVGAHFGYIRSRRHPSVKPYIFGTKNKVEIFDLEKTEALMNEALAYVAKLASENKQILFIGGKHEAREIVKDTALALDMPYVSGRFIGGTMTNFPEIRKRVERFESLTSQKEKGELAKYTKKERLLIDREIVDLDTMFGGLLTLKSLPAALFVIDSKRETIAVEEARRKGIPVISLSGSDCDISVVDYPIVANDSSVESIAYFVKAVADTYKKNRPAKAAAAAPAPAARA